MSVFISFYTANTLRRLGGGSGGGPSPDDELEKLAKWLLIGTGTLLAVEITAIIICVGREFW